MLKGNLLQSVCDLVGLKMMERSRESKRTQVIMCLHGGFVNEILATLFFILPNQSLEESYIISLRRIFLALNLTVSIISLQCVNACLFSILGTLLSEIHLMETL